MRAPRFKLFVPLLALALALPFGVRSADAFPNCAHSNAPQCQTATPSPTAVATPTPTIAPTASPTPRPTTIATPVPTVNPTPTPTIRPTASPSPSGSPVAGSVLFVADGETGDTSQFCYVHSAVPVGVVTSPVYAGRYAYKAEVRDGYEIYNTERSEYDNGPGTCNRYWFKYGDETWTRVRFWLDPTFPHSSDWALVVQWKEPNAGTPPQQISLQSDTWQIIGSGTISPRQRFPFGTVERGKWVTFLVHQKWSTDPSVGFTEVYKDGALALPLTHMKTMDDTNSLFLGVGYYRDTAPTTGTGILYFDDVKVATTKDAASN